MRKLENRTPRPKKRDAVFAPSACVPPSPRTFVPHVKGQLARDVVKTSPGQCSELKKMEVAVRSARSKNGTVYPVFRDPFHAPNRQSFSLRRQTESASVCRSGPRARLSSLDQSEFDYSVQR